MHERFQGPGIFLVILINVCFYWVALQHTQWEFDCCEQACKGEELKKDIERETENDGMRHTKREVKGDFWRGSKFN